MRILFIGDVVGRSGRTALEEHLPYLKDKLAPDMIIVNGENAASGMGITSKICKAFYSWGVDVITTGNHVWDQREILSYIGRDQRLLRPINYPPDAPGRGFVKVEARNGKQILVLNAMARTFMQDLDDPFRLVKEALVHERLGQSVDAIFVDFHGETTSETMAFGHYMDGQVSAVVGTHTHVPTADAHIMPGGTAYQTDAGMTGPYDSVIGVEKNIAIHRFVKKTPGEKFRPARSEATLCGTFIVTDDRTGLAVSIDPVRLGGILPPSVPELSGAF